MSIWHDAYRNVLLPRFLPQQYHGLSLRWRELERAEGEPVAANLARQWQSMQEMLEHAYATTPFYRQRFDEAGLLPANIHAPADLARLPLLTRDDIRQRLVDLRSRIYDPINLQASHTGGTTDTPVALLRNPECVQVRFAVQSRFNAWAGILPGDKVLWQWGAAQDFSQRPSLRWKLFERYALRRCWAFTSQLNEEIFESHRALLNDFRPKAIIAYPTSLALLCEYLEHSGRAYHHPEAVLVTAEPLLPEQRSVIQRVMGCDPFVQYGTRDFGMPAAECEKHTGLHINPAATFIEFLPVDEGGDLCEMVITDLTNRAMPMIRYKINDCAMIQPDLCACGRGYPMMSQVTGRTTDNFYLADGTVISGVTLPGRILKVCPGIRKMQVIQETYSDFRVRYVPGGEFTSQNLEEIRSQFQRYVGNVNLDFEQVADIAREPSGKTRVFISRVKPTLGTVATGRWL